eukprot:scaffold55872_cov78-Cyclotella_meneghiniana.AAC.1
MFGCFGGGLNLSFRGGGLGATVQADLEQQKRLERDIKSAVNHIKSLKSLEQKVLRADDLHRKIQSDLAELERLDRQNYIVDDGESTVDLQYFLDEAKAGKIELMKDRGVMFYSELERGVFHTSDGDGNGQESTQSVEEIPASAIDNEEDAQPMLVAEKDYDGDTSDNTKKKRRRKPKTYSARNRRCRFVFDKAHGCWVPKWMMIVGSGQSTVNKEMINGLKRLKKLFSGRQCRFSAKARRTIAISSLAAAGASDYGVQSVIFGTLKAITDEMGLGLTPNQLANASPDVGTLRNWELNVAAGCMAKVISQIARDAEHMTKKYNQKLQITLVTDHGNRAGVDHFVKMIVWTSIDKAGRHKLNHFNLDIDKGGHTTVAAANAIHRSLQSLKLAGMDVEFSFICGDSGGGAKVQKLYPTLMNMEVLSHSSDFVNCILHAFNLAYEHACKDALGDQGMNRCSVFQMCYLAILVLKTVKKQSNGDTLKKIYETTMHKVLLDEKYVASSKECFIQAWDDLLEEVETLESADDVESVENMREESLGLEELLLIDSDDDDDCADEEVRAKKQAAREETKKKIAQFAKECPTNVKDPNFSRWGTISAVAKVVLKHWLPLVFMAQNITDVEKNGSYLHVIASKLLELMSAKAKPSQASPTHFTSLKWVVAFGDAFFDAHMEWVKRHDPVFGAGSYGHISRLVPEHLFVMHKQFEALKNDGWRSVPEFAGFVKAVDGVEPAGDVNKGGLEFFERLPNLFFQRFEESFTEHTRKWRTPKTLPIIIAGHPMIAKSFLRWVFGQAQSFPDENIVLKHHYLGKNDTIINVKECLTWLTDGAFDSFDPPNASGDKTAQLKEALMNNRIIQDIIEDLRQFAECEDDEIWALDLMRKEDEDERKHLEDEARLRAEQDGEESAAELHNNTKKPRRRTKVEGKKRLELHAQWIDAKCQEIDDGIAFLESQEKGIMADIMAEMCREHKSSRVADDEKLTTYNRAANKQ